MARFFFYSQLEQSAFQLREPVHLTQVLSVYFPEVKSPHTRNRDPRDITSSSIRRWQANTNVQFVF